MDHCWIEMKRKKNGSCIQSSIHFTVECCKVLQQCIITIIIFVDSEYLFYLNVL